MKRSALKPGKGFKPRETPMARGSSVLKTSKSLNRGQSQLARAAKPIKSMPAKRSRGMKGRAPTADERRFMDAAGALPCIACQKDGRHEPVISLHHIDGRTKPGAHLLVLPLCAPHHQQDDSDPLQRQSVHGRKATFTARYGTEMELLEIVRSRVIATQK